MSGDLPKFEKRLNKKKSKRRNESGSDKPRRSSKLNKPRSERKEMSSVVRTQLDGSTCSRRLFSTRHELRRPY